jgi:parvulin-like peptidyl-prolyl isomerase
MWYVRVFTLIFVILLGGCKGKQSVLSSAERDTLEAKKNYIILRVEDTVYFNADYVRYLRFSIGAEYDTLSTLSLSRLVDDFVEEKILLADAQKKEIVLTWEEKKNFLAKYSSDTSFEEDGWPLDEEGADLLFEQLLVERYTYDLVKDIDVSDEEIGEYYNANKREFLLPERVKVSQILLPNEEKAVEIMKNLKDNDPENFKRLARTHSMGVEASKEGEMGIFAIGQLPTEMESVIFSLKEGEVSQVLESSYGFHIFRLDSRFEPELMPLDRAAAPIKVKLLSQKVKHSLSQHIQNLKNTSHWEFYEQNLYFPYQRISDE